MLDATNFVESGMLAGHNFFFVVRLGEVRRNHIMYSRKEKGKMRCKVRTLSLNKRLAKNLPMRDWTEDYIPYIVGFIYGSVFDWYLNYVLVQLEDAAFWCRVGHYAPEDLHLDEITLY